MERTTIPDEFRKYLWDAKYIIARVLEHGNIDDAKKFYSYIKKSKL